MAPRKLVTVGIEIGSPLADHIDFNSSRSLLDWDVVVFLPDISEMARSSDSFQGKVALYEHQSFQLKERTEHWRREIRSSLDAGRTVICYLDDLNEIFVDSGNREFSGTGRNQRTTRLLDGYSNYKCLPLPLDPRSASGKAMKVSPKAGALSAYWQMFGDQSEFKVVIEGQAPTAPIQTKASDLNVGGIYSFKSGGNLVCLPMLEFYEDEYFEDGDTAFNADGKDFGAKLHSAWLGIDTSLRASTELTPPPAWLEDDGYVLEQEAVAKASLLAAEEALVVAQKHKEAALDAVQAAASLKALLFEKGTPLETSIIEALQILGFSAAPYKDADSEFDVVFECPEGRLLGEAEGKDNKAINVDKLRQLAMNVHEDLARDEVTTAAKPVLFGNGYRLTPPEERGECFTEKCVNAAKSSNTALVATMTLFRAAKHAKETADAQFAQKCRLAILETAGNVLLPTDATD